MKTTMTLNEFMGLLNKGKQYDIVEFKYHMKKYGYRVSDTTKERIILMNDSNEYLTFEYFKRTNQNRYKGMVVREATYIFNLIA